MFFLGSLSRWWINRSRKIFRYWDGSVTRRVDPLGIGKEFERLCPERFKLFETLYKNPDKIPPGNARNELLDQQKAAGETLAKVSREVFQVPPLDETKGMTDGECIRIMTRYLLFMNRLAEDAQVFPNWPEAE